MILSDVMDEIAVELRKIAGLRVYEWPSASVNSPSAVILYPPHYEYDLTYGRGFDRVTIPVAVLVGRASERSTRDLLTVYLNGSGPKSIKAVIEAGMYTSFDSIRVVDVNMDVMTMGGVDYWGAVFNLDVTGQGN